MSADPQQAEEDPVDSILAAHRGDAHAAIAGLLCDLHQTRSTIDIAGRAISYGFTRGWLPVGNPKTDNGE